MCGIPQSSRVIVTLCASFDQRARSVREGEGDCAPAVEASAAHRRTSLLKYLVMIEGMAAKTCMSSNQYIAPITERGETERPSRPYGLELSQQQASLWLVSTRRHALADGHAPSRTARR